MAIVDLHVHSTKSDGSFTPSQLVDYALEKGLSAFALTDHDCVDGLDEAIGHAEGKNIEVIPGIELSTEYEGRDIHIVGLYIDYKSQPFQEKLQEFVDSRIRRNKKMCANLQEAGIDISYEALLDRFPDSVITRSHYARFMMEHGDTKNMKEAFEKYIGDHCPCYVPREKITPVQAIELILEADGIPVLAHPILYHFSDAKLDRLTGELKSAGLIGIEAVYSTYSPSEEREIRSLADKHHLLLSGGSDFHGVNKPGLDLAVGYGKLSVPEEILDALRQTRKKLLFTDLDGTLLRSDCTVSDAMKQAIDRLVQNGHRLILSSGRPLGSILSLCRDLSFNYKNMLIIAFNGSLVYDVDRKVPLFKSELSGEEIKYLIRTAKEFGLHCQGYTENSIVTPVPDEEIAYYTSRIHLPVTYTETPEQMAEILKNGSCKLMCIDLHCHRNLTAFRDAVREHCGSRFQLIFSNDKYLEIFPENAGKGNAVSYVTEYYHMPLSHTYAAGDAENDLSMLEAAGHPIAVKNASENIKSAAEIVTENDNNHDGLIEVLTSSFYN